MPSVSEPLTEKCLDQVAETPPQSHRLSLRANFLWSLAGNVIFSDSADDGKGELSEADQEKLAEMQAALQGELQREWKLSGHNMDLLMNDKEAAEFLMENYGHAVLLK